MSPLAGILDEIRVWDVARSEGEIEDLLLDHLTGSEAGLEAAWDLDDGSGGTAADLKGTRPALLGDAAGSDARDPAWTSTVAPVRRPTPGLSLGFEPAGPAAITSGEVIDVNCEFTAGAGAAPGVTAWNLAVRHDRPHLALEEVSLVGTGADLRQADGFAKYEILDDSTRAGFVSSVVLSASGGASLSPVGTSILARARYRGVLNYTLAETAWVRYDHRLPASTLGINRNVVVAGGAEKLPAEGHLVISITSPSFSLGFDPAKAAALPGKEFSVSAVLTTDGNKISSGPIAWSISVKHDPAVLELVEATTVGTALDAFRPEDIFLMTEEVDNETGTGFVSVAILNLSGPRSLPANGKATVAIARYRALDGTELGTHTTVAFSDGLRGSGVPIGNGVTFLGGVEGPSAADLDVLIDRVTFVRGNANGDGRINLSDVNFIINRLFKSGPAPRCLDAADVNDDGKINLSDVIYLAAYLFQSGRRPPAPFPLDGDDPTADKLGCEGR
jgi:hypothetical protein